MVEQQAQQHSQAHVRAVAAPRFYYLEHMAFDDVPAVRQIEQVSFPSLWPDGTYEREMRQPERNRYLVARVRSTPPPPRTAPPPRPTIWHHARRLLGAVLTLPPPPTSPDRIVGYAGVWTPFDEGHITAIAVDPPYRRQGVGELLLLGLIEQAMDMGAHQMTLEVRVSNTAARLLYERYGFREAGVRRRYYTDNHEDALIMWTDNIRSAAYQALLTGLRQQLFARLRVQAHTHALPGAPPPLR